LGFLPKFSPKILWFPQEFWVIIAKFRCIWVSLGDPKNQITK
jgi:hypothetical protein